MSCPSLPGAALPRPSRTRSEPAFRPRQHRPGPGTLRRPGGKGRSCGVAHGIPPRDPGAEFSIGIHYTRTSVSWTGRSSCHRTRRRPVW